MNETRPDERARLQERARLTRDVANLWPSAPYMETGQSGRWIRFDHPTGGAVYLQRYSWDEPCMPHFLVVSCDEQGVLDQRRFDRLDEAVAAIQRALGRPALDSARSGEAPRPVGARPPRAERRPGAAEGLFAS